MNKELYIEDFHMHVFGNEQEFSCWVDCVDIADIADDPKEWIELIVKQAIDSNPEVVHTDYGLSVEEAYKAYTEESIDYDNFVNYINDIVAEHELSEVKEKFMTAGQVANEFNIATTTVTRACEGRWIPSLKIDDRTWLIRRVDAKKRWGNASK